MIFKSIRLLSWEGPLPQTGQYMQTPKGSTYQIIATKPPASETSKTILKLDTLKLTPEEISVLPRSAIIHPFKWLSRSPKSKNPFL